MEYFFEECKNININENSVLNAKNCINCKYMFYGNDLKNVNFSFLDIRNAESLQYCFSECKNIQIHQNSILKLKNSINMDYTFYKTVLINVNFSFLDIGNAESLQYCFSECKNIQINQNSILKLKNCINMDYTFYKTVLVNVNFSFLDIRNAESLQYCFSECKNIQINQNSILKL